MIVYKNRASAIIYNFLMTLPNKSRVFLLPSNICPIVPLTFCKAKVNFEFVDINEKSLCMDLEIVKEILRKDINNYMGILFVHTYGVNDVYEEEFKAIKAIKEDLLIIEDKCLSIPEFNENTDSCVDMILYSTGYSKVVELGCGGFAFIKSNIKYTNFKCNFSEKSLEEITNQYKYSIANNLKFNYKDCEWLDTNDPEEQVEVYKQLIIKDIKQIMDYKRNINSIYSQKLPMHIKLNDKFQFWRFNILVPERDKLINNIFKKGLFASCHYASVNKIFSNTYSPNSEKLSQNVLNLFNDHYFDEKKANAIVDIINDHVCRYY